VTDGQIIRFKIGEAFPADDPLARWVTVCAMALNDALLINRWLWPRLQEGVASAPHENFYLARVAAAHLFEAASFLRKHRRHPEISAFIETLEPEHQEQYEALLQIAKGDQEGFPGQLKEARNTFFHYPKLIFGQEDQEPLKRAMVEHAKDEEEQGIKRGEIRDIPPALTGFRAGFADDIATEMMLPENTGEEFPKFISNVSTNLGQLLSFLQAVLNAYTQTKPGVWEVEDISQRSEAAIVAVVVALTVVAAMWVVLTRG
jgi:hypothetical protein